MSSFFKILSLETEYPHWHDPEAWVIKTKVKICGKEFEFNEIVDSNDLWPNLKVQYNSDFGTFQTVCFCGDSEYLEFYFVYEHEKKEHKLIISSSDGITFNKDIKGIDLKSSEPLNYEHHFSKVYEKDILYVGEIEEYYHFLFSLLHMYYAKVHNSENTIFRNKNEKKRYLQQIYTAIDYFPNLAKYSDLIELLKKIDTNDEEQLPLELDDQSYPYLLNHISPFSYTEFEISDDNEYPCGLRMKLIGNIKNLGDHIIEICPFDFFFDFYYFRTNFNEHPPRGGAHKVKKAIKYNKEFKNNHYISYNLINVDSYLPGFLIEHQFLLVDEKNSKLFSQSIPMGQGVSITSYIEFEILVLRKIFVDYYENENCPPIINDKLIYLIKQVEENITICNSQFD